MGKQKAVFLLKQVKGETDNIEIQDRDIPEAAEGEVLIRVQCRPINPADVLTLQGLYPGFQTPNGLPSVPGLEGMGTVEAVGPGCTGLSKGQRVTWGGAGNVKHGEGTWQQYGCYSQECVFAVSDKLTDQVAAQFFVNPCTAFGLLDVLAAPKGSWILQNAAGSVLGRQLIQIARHQGLKTINLVRRQEQVKEILQDVGGDEALCTADDGWVERVKEITGGEGAYGAVDCIGADITLGMVQALRHGGTVLIYGALGGFTATVPVLDILFQGKVVKGFLLSPWLAGKGSRKRAQLEEVLQLLEQGVVQPYSGSSFPLEQAKQAVQEAQKPARGGKVFITG